MKKAFIFIIITLVFLIFTGCEKPIDNTEELREKDEKIEELENRISELQLNLDEITSDNTYRAAAIIKLIKAKDMAKLAQYVHPAKGIRFTPYFYIDVEKDKVFTVEEVKGLMENDEVYNWGAYDGSGFPIDLIFKEYYDNFIYDADFANPQVVGNNTAIGGGNTVDNIAEAYPNGYFLEFHFSQIDPQYAGIDWRSLRLVFEEYNNIWYLVGIVHGEWTI